MSFLLALVRNPKLDLNPGYPTRPNGFKQKIGRSDGPARSTRFDKCTAFNYGSRSPLWEPASMCVRYVPKQELGNESFKSGVRLVPRPRELST
jgi:hypothetical protein